MNITTHPKIWTHRDLLPVVHQANEIIESEAGPKSPMLTVSWGLAIKSGFPCLTVTVVDSESPQKVLVLSDWPDLEKLRSDIRTWMGII